MSLILVDPVYNPELVPNITSDTKLGPGVTIAKFLGAYGDRTPFNHIRFDEDRRQIARNLYMHGLAINSIAGNTIHFNDVRLIVSEGLYRGGPSETPSGKNKQKRDGELIYYQVIDREGNIDFEKTFDVAVYWKDYIAFDELYLDYDTYNPDGTLTAQVGLKVPQMSETFEGTFNRKVQTWFNNNLQTNGELVEILPED